jgi:uncharacterized phiE125 gp8 family phage protein
MKVLSGIYTSPATLPVDVEDYKAFVRQFASFEDDMLERVLGAAVQEAEKYLQTSLEKQSRIVYINGTPEPKIELDMGPVRSITSVKYTDMNGALQTISPADYVLGPNDVLYPAAGVNWPTSNPQVLGGFQIIYVAGLAEHTASPIVALKESIETGIFLLTQGIIEKRKDCTDAGYWMLNPDRRGQGV